MSRNGIVSEVFLGAEVLERLGEELADLGPPFEPPTGSRPVDAMLACIHRRVFEPQFNVAALRRQCRMKDNNSSSKFRQRVGVTPRVYIEGLRLYAAVKLLRRYPEVPALDVALLVGYEHPQTFYRAFHRTFGVPPGRARDASAELALRGRRGI